jgi:hypothetical protein
MVSRRGRYIRDEDMEDIIESTLSNIFGSDWFSRNSNIRLSSARSMSGSSDPDRTMQEGLLADMIRKCAPSIHTHFLFLFFFFFFSFFFVVLAVVVKGIADEIDIILLFNS